ncbi:MAG: hypothetical protein R3344_02545 [Acidobacteriota bacterium]|nr:hypothetical protein [Acidobacteriota bacterium]
MSESQTDPIVDALDSLDDDVARDVAEALRDVIAQGAPGSDDDFRALDPSVLGEGGQAFLWEDVLTLAELADATGPLLPELDPVEAAKLLLSLATAWKRMRSVRVPLTEREYRVLKAVKRECKSVSEIADRAGIDRAKVEAAIESLRAKRYKVDTPLLDGEDGNLSTVF